MLRQPCPGLLFQVSRTGTRCGLVRCASTRTSPAFRPGLVDNSVFKAPSPAGVPIAKHRMAINGRDSKGKEKDTHQHSTGVPAQLIHLRQASHALLVQAGTYPCHTTRTLRCALTFPPCPFPPSSITASPLGSSSLRRPSRQHRALIVQRGLRAAFFCFQEGQPTSPILVHRPSCLPKCSRWAVPEQPPELSGRRRAKRKPGLR